MEGEHIPTIIRLILSMYLALLQLKDSYFNSSFFPTISRFKPLTQNVRTSTRLYLIPNCDRYELYEIMVPAWISEPNRNRGTKIRTEPSRRFPRSKSNWSRFLRTRTADRVLNWFFSLALWAAATGLWAWSGTETDQPWSGFGSSYEGSRNRQFRNRYQV